MMEQQLYVEEFIELRALERQLVPQSTIPIAPFRELVVDNASFRYSAADTNAVDGVNVSISAGEVIALLARTVPARRRWRVLSGLYEPATVRSGGTAPTVPTHTDGGLSEAGVVFQDFARYWFSPPTTLRSVTWTGPTITPQSPQQPRCRRTGLSSGCLTLRYAAGCRGGRRADISGGQWQRIAIARCCFGRRRSSSSTNDRGARRRTEAALFDTIQDLRAGRTSC